MPRVEQLTLACHLSPGDASETRDDAGADERELAHQMVAAVRNFLPTWIAIATCIVAGITSHQVSNEITGNTRLSYHLPQKRTRAVAAEGNPCAIGAETAGRQADEGDIGGGRAVTRHDA